MSTPRFPSGLYGITPDWADTEHLLQAIRQAHAGGMRVLQWRRKSGSGPERMAQAQAIRQLCRQLKLPLIINDSWQLAAELDADGVHLGLDDGAIEHARQALGPNKLIGCSCYDSLELAHQRLQQGANYIAFGSMFPSQIKPEAAHASIELIRSGARLSAGHERKMAIVAIGGLTADNAAPIVAAGADGIAVISALFLADDVKAAARRLSSLFLSSSHSG